MALGASAAAANLQAGDSSARAKGVSVKLDIDSEGGVSLTYAMKTACGKSNGKIALSKSGSGLAGRKVSRGPRSTLRTTVAKVTLSRDRSEAVGTLKESLKGGKSELSGCRAERIFSASVQQPGGVHVGDDGHYTGTGPNGLPISFDVVTNKNSTRVENLAVDVTAVCVGEGDPYQEEISKVVHVTGMAGRVALDNSFHIELVPDDDTWYEFDGQLREGKAEVDVTVGGIFDATGNPSPAGAYFCDSWGDIYDARRR